MLRYIEIKVIEPIVSFSKIKNSIHENEYYIIKSFLKEGYDYIPKNWEAFKKMFCHFVTCHSNLEII